MRNKYLETVNGLLSWWVVFCLTVVVVALGQPDRHPIFALLAYIFGYSGIFALLMDVEKRSSRFLLGILWAGLVQLFQLNWMATTYYHGYMIVSVYLFLCLWLSLQFAFLVTMLPKWRSPGITRSLAIASVWTLMEWSRLYFVCGFPFNSVGLVMTYDIVPMQIASLFGIYGLSFWVMFAASLGAAAWRKRTTWSSSFWVAVVAFPFCFGWLNIALRQPMGEEKTMNVALLQIGLSSEQKWFTRGREGSYMPAMQQWKRIFRFLEERGKEKYDIIVLPESALPGDASEEMYPLEEAKKLFPREDKLPPISTDEDMVSNLWIAEAMANFYECEVLAGFLESEEGGKSYNSAFHIVPFKDDYRRYDKRILVPITEYLPFKGLKSLAKSFGLTSFFTPGTTSQVFNGRVPYAVSICFEEGFGSIIREGRLQGAKMFVNMTNDGWFPRSRLPVEHFNLGRVRAVENGVPVLRACNTGVTAVIDCFGRTIASLDEVDYKNDLVSGALVAKVGCHSYETLFAKWGNGLIVFLSLIIMILHGVTVLYKESKYFI